MLLRAPDCSCSAVAGPVPCLSTAFPVHECWLSGSADGAAVLPSCAPAQMQAAPRQESGSCLGCLDPAWDAWIPSVREIEAQSGLSTLGDRLFLRLPGR